MSSVCLPEPAHSATADIAATTLRPNLIRRETDYILSYYQSEHAGRSYDYESEAPYNSQEQEQPQQQASTTPLRRLRSTRREHTTSTSSEDSSHYSSDDEDDARKVPTAPYVFPHAPTFSRTPEHTEEVPSEPPQLVGTRLRHSRRISTPSEGGADRRRLAIVEMDATTTMPPMSASVGHRRSRGLGLGSDGKSANLSLSSTDTAGGTLFSRRGLHIGGLALVAPPDASPRTYTDLTPPSTAPVSSSANHPPPSAFLTHSHTRSASEAVDDLRSRLHHKSSRDVGIVGLSSASTASDSLSPASPTSEEYYECPQSPGLGVPIFQTPAKSRSPSPGTTPELSDSSSAVRSAHQRLLSTPIFVGMDDGIVTPAIGEGKDIGQPVVGPVIVGLSPSMMQGNVSAASRTSPPAQSPPASHHTSSPYLHYQPGVHSTAGPLPPPPRSIFEKDNKNSNAPPPRPPRYHTPLPGSSRRDIDAIKEALQLPQSVSAKLAARTPSGAEADADKQLGREPSPPSADTQSEESTYSEEPEPSIRLVSSNCPPVHVREGAFPPSRIVSPQQSPAPLGMETRPFVLIEQEEPEEAEDRRPGMELRREDSWVSLRQDAGAEHSSPNGRAATLPVLAVSRSPSSASEASSSSSVSRLPSLPPKSIRHFDEDKPPSAFKGLTNLKRFSSLPRTPSHSSRSSKRSPSPRSPSPPPPPSHDYQHTPIPVELPPRKRVPPKVTHSHSWPQAMNPADIVALRSSRDRAKAYAMKINELSTYDCGLRKWLDSQSYSRPASHPRVQPLRATQQPLRALPPEFGGALPGPRHVSHGSLASDMTFPIRSDAYTATDLSTRPIDVLPSSSPPAILPYPSLAIAQAQRSPVRSSVMLSPTKSKALPFALPSSKGGSGTGFFASLGRKTSMRKERGTSLLAPPSQTPARVLTKPYRPQGIAASVSQPAPARPPPPPTTPSVPGGPRAAPGHIKRAKTFSVGPGISPPVSAPISAAPAPSPPRPSPSPPAAAAQHVSTMPQMSASAISSQQRQSIAPPRRPSLFARARPGHMSVNPAKSAGMGMASVDPNFARQVDKLADLLPHADRAVLAGYLRRAGEDILAIGQYLEDEKNGTLKRD